MTEPAPTPGTWLAPPCIYCGQPVPAGSTERAAHYVRGRGGGWAHIGCLDAMQQAQQRMEWTGEDGDGDEGEEDAA